MDPPTHAATADDPLATTRRSLQAVAEHILSAARHAATGRIGLRATPGGFGTPPFPTADGGERWLAVDGADLISVTVQNDASSQVRAPLTTLREAGLLAGVEPGAPTDLYTPSTPLALDAPLTIEPEAARRIADWYALVDAALERLCAEQAGREPAIVQLWPEHFDLATSIDEVNYGGAPGDATQPEPYLYVGPWSPPAPDGDFWNRPYGASLDATAVASVDDAVAFFHEGIARAGRLASGR